MHEIKTINLGQESSNGMKYKIVDTTAGSFETRCSAYNQSIEKVEGILKSQKKGVLFAPPLKVWTFMYDRAFKPRQKFLYIKQLTESRITGKEFHGVNIFDYEINFLKRQLTGSDKVVLVNYLMPLEHWKLFNKEDVLSMCLALCKTGTPHITIPVSPRWSAEDSLRVLETIKINMNSNQSYFLNIHPHMDLDEQKRLVNTINIDNKCKGVIMNGCTPMEAHNMVSYRLVSKALPNDKLLIFSDVQDVFGGYKLPTQIAFRMLNADITCRAVKPYLAGNIFSNERKKSFNKVGIYVDEVGAILNEHEQKQWTGKSTTSLLNEHFSLQDNVNSRELALAYNFSALNKTAEIERRCIDQEIHEKYIEDRVHLSAFMNAIQKIKV